jgi:CheY-like chemotaxis protein
LLAQLSYATAGWSRARVFAPVRTEPAASQRRGISRATILTVDDEADAREFLRISLSCEGFDVIEASSGIEALIFAARHRFDLAIVDVMMAGMTGLELCDELRARRDTRHIPIILYSAYEMNQHSNAGLYDHALVKPVELSDLLETINRLLPRIG